MADPTVMTGSGSNSFNRPGWCSTVEWRLWPESYQRREAKAAIIGRKEALDRSTRMSKPLDRDGRKFM